MRLHWLSLTLVITLAASILTEPAMARTLPSEAGESPKSVSAGVWGGQSLHLEVTAQGATLEFDCATGTILEPLVLDAKGRFRVNGTFQSGNFGPARKGVRPASQPTIYTGTIDGETMRIEFTLPGNSQPEGPFTLTRGSSGRLRKCQ
jgi:hypothetical protein